MGDNRKSEGLVYASTSGGRPAAEITNPSANKSKAKDKDKDAAANKRRCVSTACIACRRRKSKCDGNLPKCAACASVYLTECEYAPHTDNRRKGVYKKDHDNVKTKNTTLQVLIQALLNAEEDEDAFDLVRQIRTCDNLEELAQNIENRERGIMDTPDSPIYGHESLNMPQFEAELSGKMGDLVIDGSIKFVGGTSNLIWLHDPQEVGMSRLPPLNGLAVRPREEAILSWTNVTQDKDLILHFLNMYFCWHYAYFTTLSKELFYRDFLTGTSSQYCSSLLVNVMLALGCHFSSKPAARANPDESSTTGDHFFAEAKTQLQDDSELAFPKLCTVQALALMSVREAGCGREGTGWIYSGMSFRLASDLGLNVDADTMNDTRRFSDEDLDARRITFWGCFLFDKCWSNYLGRQPQFLLANSNVKKPEVFGLEDAEMWSPYTDSGVVNAHSQPARTRAVSLQIFKLAEISSDLLTAFYQPQHSERSSSKQNELKRLTDIHTRLESWRKDLPQEMEAKDGQLPQVLLMHMFYQLLYIHLYRPFLKYTKATSPLPSHISPRKFCTQAASSISKLFRLYKRTHGLRQICNIAVYIAHSACTIHLLNLPDKNARRDIIHGVKQLEEIGECWLCARRTLRILGLCAEKWKIELPDEAEAVIQRSNQRLMDAGSPSMAPSPETISNALNHLQSQPASNGLGQGWQPSYHQQQEDFVRHLSSSSGSYGTPPGRLSTQPESVPSVSQSMVHPQDSIFAIPAIPDQFETGQGQSRSKISLNLTQAQQDAWNALQAKMGHVTPSGTRTPNEQPSNAAVLFGGIDSLIEESQDWWYNDQSQIALGFDNWNTPSSADWTQVGSNGTGTFGSSSTPDSSTHGPTTTQAPRSLMNTSHLHQATGHLMSMTSIPPGGYTLPAQLQQQQQQQHLPRQIQSLSASPPQHKPAKYSNMMPAGQKRSSSYDDDLMY